MDEVYLNILLKFPTCEGTFHEIEQTHRTCTHKCNNTFEQSWEDHFQNPLFPHHPFNHQPSKLYCLRHMAWWRSHYFTTKFKKIATYLFLLLKHFLEKICFDYPHPSLSQSNTYLFELLFENHHHKAMRFP